MASRKLNTILRPIVQEYGLGHVLESLGKIASSDVQSDRIIVKQPDKKKAKVVATEYVANMEFSSEEKKMVLADMAEQFESKCFLPTFGDIRNFCEMYRIDVPASKSRASVIPRLFKFVSEMEPEEVRKMLDDGMFSGPSRLGPIADAIRRNGRTRS